MDRLPKKRSKSNIRLWSAQNGRAKTPYSKTNHTCQTVNEKGKTVTFNAGTLKRVWRIGSNDYKLKSVKRIIIRDPDGDVLIALTKQEGNKNVIFT